jgi:SP family general alpha glucoside:H+ symporter-like MFS transporter
MNAIPKKKAEANNAAIQDIPPHNVKKGEILEINTTRNVTVNEHELDQQFWEAVKQYPMAIFWAAFFGIAVIQAGFDAQLVTSFYALPAFQQRFGFLFEGEYTISAPWQTGLGSEFPHPQLSLTK